MDKLLEKVAHSEDTEKSLDAETGKIKWAFQNNYHDVWDMDTMAAPVAVDVKKGGKTVPMVIQTTKQGQVWILDARTGKPIYPYKELPVPQSKVPGEKTEPTQPFPDGLSLAQMSIDRDHLSQLSPQANADCKAVWDQNKLHNEGPYTPPAPEGWTAMVPGAIGGIDWGGVSVNPAMGYAFTNVTNMPTMVQLTHGADTARGTVKGNNGWRFSSGYVRFSDTKGRPCAGGRQGEMVAINVNTGKSVAWNVARTLTIAKPCCDEATVPVHLNGGMGVGGVPMHILPPGDATSRASRAAVDILQLDGL